MKLPKVTSTTELQRNISVLTKAPDDEVHIITKGTTEIGVYMPMPFYEKAIKPEYEEYVNKKRAYKLPPKTLSLLREIDPVKYQRDIRKEY
ncbi:hypothetical protein JW978_03590 [Candidatus Dojkabacteria bacterium]|nr:hypothetical protein [Candidatus Dojkabacteria bacterium]